MHSDVPQKPFEFQGSGPSQNASDQVTPEQHPATEPEQNAPRYLTAQDAQALFDQLFDRKAQSITDKTTYRVKKLLDAAQAQGASLNEQQARAMLEAFDREQNPEQPQRPASAQQSQQPQAGQPGPQGQSEARTPEVNHVYETADAMQARAGVTLDDGDPEIELIPQTDDEWEFLQGVRAAIEAKKERMQNQAAARVPSVSSSGAGGGGKAAITAELQRLLQDPTRNRMKIRELKGKLSQYD